MIKLNDRKKLAEDYIYYKKCNIFLILSLIFVIAYTIFLLLIAPLNFGLLFVFFVIMYTVLIMFRSNRLTTAKKIWDQKFQALEEEFANIP